MNFSFFFIKNDKYRKENRPCNVLLIGLRDFLKANHHMPSSNRFNHSELACLKFIISVYRNEAMTISKTQHTQPRQPYFSSSEESSSTPCLICFTRSYSQSDWSVLIAISFLTNQLSEIWVYDQKKSVYNQAWTRIEETKYKLSFNFEDCQYVRPKFLRFEISQTEIIALSSV